MNQEHKAKLATLRQIAGMMDDHALRGLKKKGALPPPAAMSAAPEEMPPAQASPEDTEGDGDLMKLYEDELTYVPPTSTT